LAEATLPHGEAPDKDRQNRRNEKDAANHSGYRSKKWKDSGIFPL
jgi:hypothetical protein